MRGKVQALSSPARKRHNLSLVWFLFGMLLVTGPLLVRNANGQVRESSTTAPANRSNPQPVAVLAGGCFWGVDAVFKHVKGVTGVTSGYSGGTGDTAQYETVSTGTTGHAESVRVTYDPSMISYSQLLKIFFLVAHNPTELNRQGPDQGTQYRSAIFYANEDQKRIAEAYMAAAPISYSRINDVLGAMVGAQFEYIRRMKSTEFEHSFEMAMTDFYLAFAVPYERRKIEENGDIYPKGTPI